MSRLIELESESWDKLAIYTHAIVSLSSKTLKTCYLISMDHEYFIVKGTYDEILHKLKGEQ
jgi:hypothetical protein